MSLPTKARISPALRTGLVWSIALALVMCSIAEACPNCRDAMAGDPTQAGLVRGFFWSIIFMLSMPFLILGGLSSYFYWEVCRARRAAAQQAAAVQGSSPFSPGRAAAPASEPLSEGWTATSSAETSQELEPVA